MIRLFQTDRFLRYLLGLFVVFSVAFLMQIAALWSASLGRGQDAVREIPMRISKGSWKWDPDELTVPIGVPVRIRITNEDSFSHGFAINEFKIDKAVPGNAVTTFEFTPDTSGEYSFYCSVLCGKGHFDQKGKLIVVDK